MIWTEAAYLDAWRAQVAKGGKSYPWLYGARDGSPEAVDPTERANRLRWSAATRARKRERRLARMAERLAKG